MVGFCTQLNNPISFALASDPYIILTLLYVAKGVSSPLACGFCSQVIYCFNSYSSNASFISFPSVNTPYF